MKLTGVWVRREGSVGEANGGFLFTARMLHVARVKPLADCRLYTFVDSAYLGGRDPVDLCRQLCDGGADLVQLRAKDWTKEQVEAVGRQLLPVCDAAGVRLVINDHPDIAGRIGAPLAHLGQEDFFDAGHGHVREMVPASSGATGLGLGLGLSSHAPAQAQRAIAAGAAYVAIGPVYATPTKPGRPAAGLDYVRWAAANVLALPWFAIGGITLSTLEAVLEAGARRICVVSAILNAADVVAVCGEFRRRIVER